MNLKKKYKNIPAFLKRAIWAKFLGLFVSLVIFITIIVSGNYASDPLLAWGILCWYPIVGTCIGFAGIMDKHPIMGKMGLWRGTLLAGVMNIVLLLIAHEPLMTLVSNMGLPFSLEMMFLGAFFEGAIFGLVVESIVTHRFGEGKKLMDK